MSIKIQLYKTTANAGELIKSLRVFNKKARCQNFAKYKTLAKLTKKNKKHMSEKKINSP